MSSINEIKTFVKKCKSSATFFIESSCKIRHPLVGIIPFKLFKYQKESLSHFRTNRFNIFRKCRQSGISTLTGAYCLWFGMFFSNKKILIVSKRDLDAKEFLNNIKSMYNNLPDWTKSVWKTPIWNEHEVGFANGSIIRSLTSSPDTLRSNASSLNIIDEAAFMPDMETMWAAGYSTMQHGGNCIVISCVPKDTYVITNKGPQPIDDFIDDSKTGEYTIPKYQVLGKNKLREGGFFYNSGMASTKKLITKYGEIEGSLKHPMWAYKNGEGFGWYELSELSEGDYLSIQYNMNIWGKETTAKGITITPELGYIIGLYIQSKSKTVYSKYDISQILDKLNYRYSHTRKCYWNIESQEFYELINSLDIDDHIPDTLMECNESILAPILSGIKDGQKESKRLKFTTTSEKLAKQIHILLNNFGILAEYDTIFSDIKEYHITCNGQHMHKFKDLVDYPLEDKKSSLNIYEEQEEVIPEIEIIVKDLSNKLSIEAEPTKESALELLQNAESMGIDINEYQKVISSDMIWTPIEYVEYSLKEVYDFSLPDDDDDCWAHSVIFNGFVSSNTPNGVGNWYWDKWTDAEEGGLFNPIRIHWWDMDWSIETDDPISKKKIRIAPTDGLRKTKTKEERERYGPYWSPWLEQEFKGLQAKGEAHLFKQEILSEFIGSGGTVLSTEVINKVTESVKSAPQTMIIEEPISWVNQSNGDRELLDFNGDSQREGLWVWSQPITGKRPKYSNGRIIDPGESGHTYVIGVDIATGENNDYSAIQIFDIESMEQVAEYMGRVQIPQLAKMVDWLGRWYNNALVNPERTGVGTGFIQDLQLLLYPNIWKQRKSGTGMSHFGFATSMASKPILNKALLEYITEEDGGYTIYSERLLKELQIYIRHKNRAGIETKKTGAQDGRGNHDDLVIAAALAFVASPDATRSDPMGLMPTHSKQAALKTIDVSNVETENQRPAAKYSDPNVIVPINFNNNNNSLPTTQEILDEFSRQIIAAPQKGVPATKSKKHTY